MQGSMMDNAKILAEFWSCTIRHNQFLYINTLFIISILINVTAITMTKLKAFLKEENIFLLEN